MNFAHPLALLLLLLLLPVALLYRLRVGVPRQTVATGHFWQKALAEERVRWRWRHWRSKVSLAVQMLIVVLLALAAAGPQIPPPKRIVLIIDNSATMRATDVQPTRLDAAKEVARRLVEGLRDCDAMALVTVAPGPFEVQPLTSDRALLTTAVDSVQAEAWPAAIEWAVKAAREAPMPDNSPPRIVLITDACSKEATRRAEQSGVDVLRVGTAAGNVAITCFTARRCRAEPAKCEVFVEIRNQGDQPAAGTVRLAVDEKLPSPAGRGAGAEGGLTSGPSAPFSIAKDGHWPHIFTLDLPTAARLTARIEPGDSYAFDDTAVLDVSAAPVKLDGRSPWQHEVFSPELPYWEELKAGREGGLAAIYRLLLLAESHPVAPRLPNVLTIEEFLGPSCGEPDGIDIRVPGDIGSDASTLPIEKSPPTLWIVPAVLAAVFVVLEWCLYQRRWTS
jgi:hypothetical protein